MSQNISRKSEPLHLDDCNDPLDLSIEFIVPDLHCKCMLMLLVLIADAFRREMFVCVLIVIIL